MRTTFMRQFLVTASLILLCILLIGVSFHSLLFSYLENERNDALASNASAVADLASAFDAAGEIQDNWNFRISMTFASSVSDADVVVCDKEGRIIVCSCEQVGCEHLGKIVDPEFVNLVLTSGIQYRTGLVDNLYPESRQLAAVPVFSDATGGAIGMVMVSETRSQISELLYKTFNIFVITATLVLLLGIILTSVFTRKQVRPLQQIAKTAQRFGRGDMQARVPTGCGNTREADEVAYAFNAMADSLERAEMRRSGFVANVSHELKTPMTTISGFVDGILDGTIPKEQERHYLQAVSEEVKRLSRLVRSMLQASKLQDGGKVKKRPFDLCEMLGRTILTFEQKINNKHLEVLVELPEEPVMALADPDAMTQVATNLLDNAVKFCNEGGRLRLGLTVTESVALVTVENTGSTIPEEELPLVFDRFHKTDKSRSVDRDGVGLGLYIVKTILQSHGEKITVTSSDGVTAFRFTVALEKS